MEFLVSGEECDVQEISLGDLCLGFQDAEPMLFVKCGWQDGAAVRVKAVYLPLAGNLVSPTLGDLPPIGPYFRYARSSLRAKNQPQFYGKARLDAPAPGNLVLANGTMLLTVRNDNGGPVYLNVRDGQLITLAPDNLLRKVTVSSWDLAVANPNDKWEILVDFVAPIEVAI